MKIIAILFFLVTVLANAAEKEIPASTALRYRHIQDADGKILATLDTKTGKIDFKEDPKKSVEVLIQLVDVITRQCDQKVSELQKPPPGKTKK